jgi:hypothetical protein
MKKSIQLPIQVRSDTIGDHSVFKVHVPPDSLNQWCLCLQLLHDELVDGCVFFFPPSKMKFEVRCGPLSTYHKDCNKYIVFLTAQDLDCLRYFYLKYFKNGFAEVDHVDIEDIGHEGCYLTFYASEYAAPVSADEARKRLVIY